MCRHNSPFYIILESHIIPFIPYAVQKRKNSLLAEHNMVLCCPCADHVHDTFGAVFTGAAHTLSIDADNLIAGQFRNRTGPGDERGLQFFGIQSEEHAVERVMRRNACRKAEESTEPLLLGPAEVLHVVSDFRPADNGSYGNEKDVFQHMGFGTFHTRVCQF